MPTLDEAFDATFGATPAPAPLSEKPPRGLDEAFNATFGSGDTKLKATLTDAVRRDPVKTARAHELSKRTGLHPDAVVNSLMDVEMQQAVADADVLLQTDASMLKRFRDQPLFAAKAQKDLKALIELHGELKGFKGPEPTVMNIVRGLAAVPGQTVRTIKAGLGIEAADFLESLGATHPDEIDRKQRQRELTQAQNASSYTRPEFETTLGSGLYGIGETAIRMAPALAAFAITKSPTAPLWVMGAQVQPESYLKYRERGATPGEATLGSTLETATELVTEIPTMNFMVKAFGKAGFGKFLSGVLGRETVTEEINTLITDAIDTAIANPNKTWEQYLTERPSRALETLITTVGYSGLLAGASSLARRLGDGQAAAQYAQEDADRLKNAFAAAKLVQMREHAPADFGSAIQSIADEEDGTQKSVFIDADVFSQAIEKLPKDQLQKLQLGMPDVLAQVPNSLSTGASIEVPIGVLLATVTDTPLEDLFLQNSRANEHSLSLVEAKQASEQAQSYMATEAEKVMQQAADTNATQVSAEAVKSNILGQLATANRFTADVNETQATLIRDFYTTLAGRLGTTPEDAYARFPLQITAENVAGDVLNSGDDIGREMADRIAAEPDAAVAEYNALEESNGGQILNTDLARELSPQYRADRTRSADVHEASSAFVKKMYADRLAAPTPEGKEPVVLFTAGGTGAGKSTGLAKVGGLASTAEIIFDTNMNTFESADLKIQQALKAGRKVAIVYTFRDPVEALTLGALPRATRMGRTVPLDAHEETHTGARLVMDQLAEKYAGNPNVEITAIDNSKGKGNAEITALANIPQMADNDLKGKLYAALEEAYQTGAITEAIYRGTKGDVNAAGAVQSGSDETAGGQLEQSSSQFRAWFGEDSTLVDESGEPLVLYHGTDAVFSTFRRSKTGAMGGAVYLADTKSGGETYDGTGRGKPRVMAVHARGKYLTNAQWTSYVNGNGWAGAEAAARADGFSGVYDTQFESAVAVWNPADIKAITNATPTASANIYRQAQRVGDVGELYGPKAELWKPFNPEYFLDLEAPLAQPARGTFNPRTLELSLLKDADLSTLSHELGHFFLEVMANVSTAANAPEAIVNDMATVLKWFGVKDIATWNAMTLDQKRPYHEKFAESWEQYLFEGNAPTVELKPLFRRFREWMVNVYRSLEEFARTHNTQLNDEVRAVFGRMVAVEDQIKEAERTAGMLPDFNATNEAIEKLQARTLRDLKWTVNARSKMLKRLQADVADKRKAVKDEVTAEVREQPEYKVQRFLKFGELDGEKVTGGKLFGFPNGDAVEAAGLSDQLEDALFKERDATTSAIENDWMKGNGRRRLTNIERSIYDAVTASTLDADSAAQIIETALENDRPDLAQYAASRAMRAAESMDTTPGVPQSSPKYGKIKSDLEASKKQALDAASALQEIVNSKQAPQAADIQPAAGPGVGGEKVTGGKLSLPVLKEMYGEGPAALWRYVATNMVTVDKTTGLHPNMVAELFGFPNGDAMTRAIVEAFPEDTEIEGKTDQRLLERYGDLVTDKGIERAANLAIHNEVRARFVASELKAMREGMNPRGKTANGGSVNVLIQAAKEFAQNLVSRRKINELKPGLHTAAEARAGRKADAAQSAGDTAGALTAKRDQLLSHYAAKYTYEAQDEVDKKLDYLRKFDKKSVRDKLPPDYLLQIDALLEQYDLRRGTTNKDITKRASLQAWVDAQLEMGLNPVVPQHILEDAALKSYKLLSVEEFRGLVDTVRNIEHLGRLKDKLLTLQDKRAFAAVVADVSNSILDNATKEHFDRVNAPTAADQAADLARDFFSSHRKISSLVRQMDGFTDNGALWNVFSRTMNKAADTEASRREGATKRLAVIFKGLKGNMGELAQIPGIRNSLSLETRLAVALNWGNETNQQRVMAGDNWSQAQVDGILQSLTTNQLHFVQNVWDFIDSYWPDIKAKEERVSGVAPEKVAAVPFVVKAADGSTVDMKGGYYPIKYDTDRSSKAEADDAAEITKQMMVGHYARATTRRGHTQARVDTVTRAVRKDINVIFQHVEQVAHDLAWHEWLIDATRLLRAKPIEQAIRNTVGPQVLREFTKAVTDIAAGDVPAQSGFERMINHVRQGATITGLGWNVMTSLLQPFGLSQSMVRIGPKWVGKGLARWIGGAARMEGTVKGIYAQSEFMRLRGETMNREMREILNKVRNKNKSTLEATYFYLIQKGQLIADVPTWLGQYEKAVAHGADETNAVAQADQAVRDAQGSGATSDLARIQRGGPLLKLFTNFYSFFNTTFNLTAESYGRTNFKNPLEAGRFAVDMLLLYTVPSVLVSLMKAALRGDDEDDDELAAKLAREQLNYLFGTMVGLREASAAISGFNGYQGPAGTRFFSEATKLAKQIEQGEVDEAALKALNNTAGTLLHYPAGAINRLVEGYLAYTSGESDNPLAPVVGLPVK